MESLGDGLRGGAPLTALLPGGLVPSWQALVLLPGCLSSSEGRGATLLLDQLLAMGGPLPPALAAHTLPQAHLDAADRRRAIDAVLSLRTMPLAGEGWYLATLETLCTALTRDEADRVAASMVTVGDAEGLAVLGDRWPDAACSSLAALAAAADGRPPAADGEPGSVAPFKYRVARALGRIGARWPGPAVAALAGAGLAADRDGYVRRAVALALGDVAPVPDAAPLLVDMIGDEYPALEIAVVRALARIGGVATVAVDGALIARLDAWAGPTLPSWGYAGGRCARALRLLAALTTDGTAPVGTRDRLLGEVEQAAAEALKRHRFISEDELTLDIPLEFRRYPSRPVPGRLDSPFDSLIPVADILRFAASDEKEDRKDANYAARALAEEYPLESLPLLARFAAIDQWNGGKALAMALATLGRGYPAELRAVVRDGVADPEAPGGRIDLARHASPQVRRALAQGLEPLAKAFPLDAAAVLKLLAEDENDLVRLDARRCLVDLARFHRNAVHDLDLGPALDPDLPDELTTMMQTFASLQSMPDGRMPGELLDAQRRPVPDRPGRLARAAGWAVQGVSRWTGARMVEVYAARPTVHHREALITLGPACVPALVARIARDGGTPPPAGVLIDAYRVILDGFGERAIEPLSTLANANDAGARRVAVDLLGRIGGEGVLSPLSGAARHADRETRRLAAEALARTGHALALPLLEDRHAEERDPAVLEAVRAARRRIWAAGGEPARRSHPRLLGEYLPVVSIYQHSLTNVDIPQKDISLFALAEPLTKPEGRALALSIPLAQQLDAFCPALLVALLHPDPVMRGDARAALERLPVLSVPGVPAAPPAEDGHVLGAYIPRLAAAGRTAVPVLAAAIDDCTREMALMDLSRRTERRTEYWDELAAGIGRIDAARAALAEALAGVCDPLALGPLVAVAQDPRADPRARRSAVWAISRTCPDPAGREIALAALDGAAQDPEAQVRATALRARRLLALGPVPAAATDPPAAERAAGVPLPERHGSPPIDLSWLEDVDMAPSHDRSPLDLDRLAAADWNGRWSILAEAAGLERSVPSIVEALLELADIVASRDGAHATRGAHHALDVLLDRLVGEPDAICYGVAWVLVRLVDESPPLRALLREQAEHYSDEAVRHALVTALGDDRPTA